MSSGRRSCNFKSLGCNFSKARRTGDLSEKAKAEITAAANLHKQGVFQDRAVGRKLMYLSESCTCQGTNVAPELGTLYVALDGMDQDRAPYVYVIHILPDIYISR